MDKSRTLYLFSLAERASALEMLAAARKCSDQSLVKGYVSHAVDEYRHAKLFSKMSLDVTNSQTESRGRSLTDVVKLSYINTDEFLIEKYSHNEFTVFIAVHESLAVAEFRKLIERLDDTKDRQIISAIIIDEEEHRNTILNDETRHAELAMNWVNKHIGLERYILFIKHYLLAKLRKSRGTIASLISPIFFWLSAPFALTGLVLIRLSKLKVADRGNEFVSKDL